MLRKFQLLRCLPAASECLGSVDLSELPAPYSAKHLNFSPPLYVLPTQTAFFSRNAKSNKGTDTSAYLNQGWVPPYGSILPPEDVNKKNGTIVICDVESMIKNLLGIREIMDDVRSSKGLYRRLPSNIIMQIANFVKDFHEFFNIQGVWTILGHRKDPDIILDHPEWRESVVEAHITLRQAMCVVSNDLGFTNLVCTDPSKTRSTAMYSAYKSCLDLNKNVVMISLSRMCLPWLQVRSKEKLSSVLQYNPVNKVFLRPQDIMEIYKVPQACIQKLNIFSKTSHIGPSRDLQFIERNVRIEDSGASQSIISHYIPCKDDEIVSKCTETLLDLPSEQWIRCMRSFASKESIHVDSANTFSISRRLSHTIKDVCEVLTTPLQDIDVNTK